MSIQSNINNIENGLNSWYPCGILRRTNWPYRVDALRNHNIREIQILWELADIFEGYVT